jgi:uncharacterized protein YggE
MMENIYEKLKAGLMVAGIIVALVAIPTAVSWSNSLYPARTITVSAEGKTAISPDLATVSFSVITQGSDPVKLESDNAQKMTEAIDFVKAKGVDAKDIATTAYDLSPNYDYGKYGSNPKIVSYTLTQTVTLKIRDFSKVAPILGGLSDRGVNQIGSVTFSVENPDKYLAPARSEAFAKAKAKAEEMAKSTGTHLGRILNFSDYQNNPQPYAIYNSGRAMGGAATASSITPTIEPGTQNLTVQVSITYELQ